MNSRIEQIHEAIGRTRKARERVQQRSAEAAIHALARAARSWLEPGSDWRKRAVEQAPATTGFSKEMVSEAVDLTFEAITEGGLRELSDSRENASPNPQLIVHFLAGNVPPPGIASICYGLLSKSANLVKVSSRDSVFPTLFVESLREIDSELADCVAVLDWRREEVALTKAALAEADTVIAMATTRRLRRFEGWSSPTRNSSVTVTNSVSR